ncbi:MAG TPA: NAD(P)/FAD-dependent oxidoreductase, partial [Thermoanaerobaculia bacterium]
HLGLARYGLVVSTPDPWIAAPLAAGGRLELWRDPVRSAEAIGKLSAPDARRWPEFCDRMHRLGGFLEALYSAPAPRPTGSDLSDFIQLAGLARRFRNLGKTGMVDLLRVLPMAAAELLDDWFESDVLKGILGAGAVTGIRQGPRSAGTTFVLLHHHVGCPVGVFRPPVLSGPEGRSVDAIFGAAAQALGAEIRRGVTVTQVTVRDDGATGVVLASGEEVAAPLVLSSADPHRTFLDLLDPSLLDPEFVRAVKHIKFRGAAARVTLSLGQSASSTPLCLAPSLEALERAYDDAKYGRISERPWLEARPAPDPGGRHRLVVHVQYAPYRLEDGEWDEGRRRALGDASVRALTEHVPDLARNVTDCEVLTPKDLEERYAVTQGSLAHGELTLDQILFMRPIPGWAHYRTPVRGLYLCGAGTHPGPGIMGGPGRLAALKALKDVTTS